MNLSVGGRELALSRGELFIILIAVLMVGYGGYDYIQQQNAIETAVAVNATITDVGVEQDGGRGIDYFPDVSYEYRFEGVTYTGDAVFPGSIRSNYDTRSEARAVINSYAENQTVTAYVDPHSPADAFLKKKTNPAPLGLAGVGGVVFVIALIRGRQNAIDAEEDYAQQQIEPDGTSDGWTILEIDHARLGTICKRFIIGSLVATWLSVLGVVVVLLATDSTTQTSPMQLDLFDPIGIIFLAAFLSACALIVSLVSYSGWSYRESRWLRTTGQFERHRGHVGLLFADEENLNRYERRIRLTEVSLLITAFLLTVLLNVLGIIDIPG